MKKIFVLAIAFFAVVSMQAQNDAISKFYHQYESDTSFSVVYVSPKMFKMVSKVAGEEFESEMGDFVKDLRGLKVLSTKKGGAALYKDAMRRIPTSTYDELVKVRDGAQNVRILSKGDEAGNLVDELLILVGEKQDFTLVSFVGRIDLNKLSKLAKKIDIKGAEHLENIGN